MNNTVWPPSNSPASWPPIASLTGYERTLSISSLNQFPEGTPEFLKIMGTSLDNGLLEDYSMLTEPIRQLCLDDGWSNDLALVTGDIYYFSIDGNDTTGVKNDISHPYKTEYKASLIASTMTAGSAIAFKRGDVWTNDNGGDVRWEYNVLTGTATAPKIVTSYGLGTRPKLNGQKTQVQTWVAEGGGLAGLWSTTTLYAPTTNIVSMRIDDVTVLAGGSTAALLIPDTAMRFYHDTDNSKLYVNIDPTLHTFKWSDKSSIINPSNDSAYFKVSHLEAVGCRGTAIAMGGTVTGCEVHHCTTGENTFRGINIGVGGKVKYNYIDSKRPVQERYMYNDGGFEGIVLSMATAGQVKPEAAYNYIVDFEHASITANAGTTSTIKYTGAKIHHNVGINTGAMKYGSRFAIQYGATDTEAYANVFIGTTTAQFDGCSGRYFNNIWIRNHDLVGDPNGKQTWNDGSGFIVNAASHAEFKDNWFINNIFYKCDGAAVQLMNNAYADVNGTVIRGNLLFDNGVNALVYPTTSPLDIQVYIRNSTEYAYKVRNSIIEDNIIFNSRGVQKQITVLTGVTEANVNESQWQYTVSEVEALVDTYDNVFRRNLTISPS